MLDRALDDFNSAIREDPKMAKAYYNRGVLFFNSQRLLDAAIKDFEQARNLEPDSPLPDFRLGQCFQQKPDTILANKYYKSWREKLDKGRKDQEDILADIIFKPKKKQDLRPDVDLEPLEKAKRELEHCLDGTAEQ
jgi:tetratricopeptide (TPR) repeat protein